MSSKHSQTKLELILQGLLKIDQKRLEEYILTDKVTMKFLNQFMQIKMDDREMELLEAELLLNGMITKVNEELLITSRGKETLTKGRREHLNMVQIQERLIRHRTNERKESNDLFFWLAISVVVISIIAFFIGVA